MEELEDPSERLKDTMEALETKKEGSWLQRVALSTAVMAGLAAIAGLMGTHHANDAVLDRIKSSDLWSYYQSKSIKSELTSSTAQILTAVGKPLPQDYAERMAAYEKQKAEIFTEARQEEKSAQEHLNRHTTFAKSVTIFHVAVALSAITILTRKKLMWYVSLILAAVGSVFLVLGFI